MKTYKVWLPQDTHYQLWQGTDNDAARWGRIGFLVELVEEA